MRIIIALATLILLSSCASGTNYYTQTIDSWRGAHVSTLIKRWGTPDDKGTGSSGNAVYLYKTVSYANYNHPASPQVGVNYTHAGTAAVLTNAPTTNESWNRGAMSLNCLAVFSVNKKGIITDTKVSGDTCYGGRQFAKAMGNPAVKILGPVKPE